MESFQEFRKSISYGSRNNLNFKFLARMTDEDAANFLEALLQQLSVFIDTHEIEPLLKLIVEGQIKAYSGTPKYQYAEGPFAVMAKPIRSAKVGLLTSSGHFVDGNDPEPLGVKEMSQQEAITRISDFIRETPILSSIPMNTLAEKLMVRHGGYDIAGALLDANVVFPWQRLQEMVEGNHIDSTLSHAYSFVGACAQGLLKQQLESNWGPLLLQESPDALLLVPA
jgi:hypothetical protein